MTIQVPARRSRPRRSRPRRKLTPYDRFKRGLDKLMAAIALANLLLIAFDYSYIPFRDFYLRQFPEFTEWYGETFKGIEPNRVTEAYLDQVEVLRAALEENGLPPADAADGENLEPSVLEPSGLDVEAEELADLGTLEPEETSPAVIQSLPGASERLADLRSRSEDLIDEDPFEVADKSGTLERIKNRLRERIGTDSAKDAFRTFWSRDYLAEAGWTSELAFFEAEIRPLMETNYYRGIGENGQPTDYFWRLDNWFILLFATDFLVRTFFLSRRYRGTSWLDTVLWRWYDIFLFLPFWRWLRVIPVVIRINQSNLLNLEPISNRIRRFIVTHFAIEMTETVIIRIIDQAQNLLKEGEVSRALLQPRRYVDLNDVNEVETITQRLVTILVYQVLPELKPELSAILDHSLDRTLHSSPLYSSMRHIPGLGNLPEQLTHEISKNVLETTYGILTASLEDEKAAALNQRLVAKLGETFRNKVKQGETVEEFEALLTVWLEEIKINYVQNLAQEDVEELREQTRRIYEISQG